MKPPMTLRLYRAHQPVEPSCVRDVAEIVAWGTVGLLGYAIILLVL